MGADAVSGMDPDAHFDRERAEGYDRRVRRLIPAYEALQELSKHILESALGTEASVLVAGAGTGNEAVALASDNPDWRITGFDPAREMIKIAREKVLKTGLSGRITLVHGFASAVPAAPPFDAAASILVMHFLPDDGSKDGFLSEVSRRLKPGAPFVLADLENTDGSGVLMSAWRRRLISLTGDPEKVDETFANMAENVKSVSPCRTLELLQNAGFERAVRFFQGYHAGAYIAVKA